MSLLRFLAIFLVPLLWIIGFRLAGKESSGTSYSEIFKGRVAEDKEKILSLSRTVRLFCFLVAGYVFVLVALEEISDSQPFKMFPSIEESRR